ncbi:hypothetical protein AAHE18_03G309800 [Arachis hypogaea]
MYLVHSQKLAHEMEDAQTLTMAFQGLSLGDVKILTTNKSDISIASKLPKTDFFSHNPESHCPTSTQQYRTHTTSYEMVVSCLNDRPPPPQPQILLSIHPTITSTSPN